MNHDRHAPAGLPQPTATFAAAASTPPSAAVARQVGPVTAGHGLASAARAWQVPDWAEAEDFVRRFHAEEPDQPVPTGMRLRQIREHLERTGSYRHTRAELEYGARVAWRNSSRCIGRLYWKSLRVLDRRTSATPDEIHADLCEHLRQATNHGRIRPVISVFAPATPFRRAPLVWNSQLIRYAGYRTVDGGVIGDPGNVDFTDAVRRLGWQAPGGWFDVLPLVIETHGDKPQLFDVPRDLVLEVPISHPDHPGFAELGLRWHAVPAISNMRLSIGGIDYPLAPFNGWYMGTEIGARNFVDADRYDLLPVVAELLGLDTSKDATLWKDRAVVELNVAVLHSFEAAGVKITDHHTESQRFLTHIEREERAGRRVPTDWSWIVPPISGGLTPVFHRYYDEGDQRPNFYLDDEARARAAGCPVAH